MQKQKYLAYAYQKTRQLPGEKNNARNNDMWCTQARKTTDGLDR